MENKIVITVEGGLIVGITSNSENVKVLVVDIDNMVEGDVPYVRFDEHEEIDVMSDEEQYMDYLETLNDSGLLDGFQVETKENEIPDGLWSFQIFDDLKEAQKLIKILDDPKWRIIPIFPDDVENFEVISVDELYPDY